MADMPERIQKILDILKREYPVARIALRFVNPYELMVSVVLSAQCTDVRVNKVTPALFKKYPDIKSMADAKLEDLEDLIRSTGFFRNKAKNLKNACKMIMERFDGKVPDTMEELLELPGIARKSANIILYVAYGIVSGIPVDTHVKRLSNRLGFTKETNPVKIERDLMALFPREEWGDLSYRLIDHGRKTCKARRPACDNCPLYDYCLYPKSNVRTRSQRA